MRRKREDLDFDRKQRSKLRKQDMSENFNKKVQVSKEVLLNENTLVLRDLAVEFERKTKSKKEELRL